VVNPVPDDLPLVNAFRGARLVRTRMPVTMVRVSMVTIVA
jgi:hypothetical protein